MPAPLVSCLAALGVALLCLPGSAAAQIVSRPPVTIPEATLLRIVEAKDQRRWDAPFFATLLESPAPAVRQRAALAAGRIGDPRAVALLSARLSSDPSAEVRAMAAFALGEIESDTQSRYCSRRFVPPRLPMCAAARSRRSARSAP